MGNKTEQKMSCVHNLSYLTKKYDGGGFTARVMEIPGIIISNNDLSKLDSEIKEVTKDWLKMFPDDYKKSSEGSLKPILVSPKRGVIVSVTPFKIMC